MVARSPSIAFDGGLSGGLPPLGSVALATVICLPVTSKIAISDNCIARCPPRRLVHEPKTTLAAGFGVRLRGRRRHPHMRGGYMLVEQRHFDHGDSLVEAHMAHTHTSTLAQVRGTHITCEPERRSAGGAHGSDGAAVPFEVRGRAYWCRGVHDRLTREI